MGTLIKRLPEGFRFIGAREHGYGQINRLSLVEILGWVLGYLKTKKLTAAERDMEKRVADARMIVQGEEGDFVFIDESEWEILGLNYYMQYMGDIYRKYRAKKVL